MLSVLGGTDDPYGGREFQDMGEKPA